MIKDTYSSLEVLKELKNQLTWPNYIAQDKSGQWVIFENKPNKKVVFWMQDPSKSKFKEVPNIFNNYIIFNGTWEESLIGLDK